LIFQDKKVALSEFCDEAGYCDIRKKDMKIESGDKKSGSLY